MGRECGRKDFTTTKFDRGLSDRAVTNVQFPQLHTQSSGGLLNMDIKFPNTFSPLLSMSEINVHGSLRLSQIVQDIERRHPDQADDIFSMFRLTREYLGRQQNSFLGQSTQQPESFLMKAENSLALSPLPIPFNSQKPPYNSPSRGILGSSHSPIFSYSTNTVTTPTYQLASDFPTLPSSIKVQGYHSNHC